MCCDVSISSLISTSLAAGKSYLSDPASIVSSPILNGGVVARNPNIAESLHPASTLVTSAESGCHPFLLRVEQGGVLVVHIADPRWLDRGEVERAPIHLLRPFSETSQSCGLRMAGMRSWMGLIAIAFENGFPKPFEILLVMPLQRVASSVQAQEPTSSPARSGRPSQSASTFRPRALEHSASSRPHSLAIVSIRMNNRFGESGNGSKPKSL
jgi:hypothetical protein